MKKKLVSSMLGASLLLAACSTDPYTGESKTSNTAKGAAIGAAAGAIGGLVLGGSNRGQATWIAALGGAAVGAGVGYYMDEQDKVLRQELRGTGVGVTKTGEQITLNMPGNITFKTNSADLSADFFEVLDSVAKVLAKYDKTSIEVAGHTDSTGSRDANMTLSYRRASAVAKYLQGRKVKASRFAIEGYGPDYPAASNSTAAGREQNRRVEIKLVPTE
ncbi:MAG: OmpA family protein [Rickettsiales bacterium]|jgi:outer membrane protein OmpA-like peptidoglycan-associated protein|nr:OmpA family protein [Rickettsiales bacterium]